MPRGTVFRQEVSPWTWSEARIASLTDREVRPVSSMSSEDLTSEHATPRGRVVPQFLIAADRGRSSVHLAPAFSKPSVVFQSS